MTTNRFLSILLALPFLVGSFVTMANPIAISYDTDITSSLNTLGEAHEYTFSGQAGDRILIRMRGTSNGVDACLDLQSSGGALLAAKCSGGGIVSIRYTLESDDTFSIIASDANNNDTGSYGLSLQILNNTDFTEAIDCDSDVIGIFEHQAQMNAYSLEADAEDVVLIQMRGSTNSLESVVELYDPNGILIASGESQNSLMQTGPIELPITGTYMLVAMDKHGNDLDTYGLSVQIINRTGCVKEISCGNTTSTSLEQLAEIDAFAFEATAGERIQLQAVTEDVNLELQLQLFDSEGNLIEVQTATANIVALQNILIESDDKHVVIVTDKNGNDTGAYNLFLQKLISPQCATQLNCGADLSASINSKGQMDSYYFEGAKDDLFIVQLRADDHGMEAQLDIYDANGNILHSHYSNESIVRIDPFALPATGNYFITVKDKSDNDTGSYGLSIQRLAADCSERIGCGADFYASLEHRAEIDAYTFEANTGDVVLLWMRGLTSKIEATMELYDPEGKLLRTNSRRGRLSFIGPTKIETSGSYTLIASDDHGNDIGDYAMSLQFLQANVCSKLLECNQPEESHRLGTKAEIDAYTFIGVAEEIISINVHELTSVLELHIELYAPDGSFVSRAVGNDVASLAKVKLPANGAYTLLVMDHEGNDIGNYTIDIEAQQVSECELDYCESTTESTNWEWIAGVNLASMVNVSANNGGYADFTHLIANLPQASTQVIQLTPGFLNPLNPFNECWRIWIDFNQDGDFEDDGELVLFVSSKKVIYRSFTIPATAKLGKTRMRVAMNFDAYPEPCGTSGNGEVEDYSVNITAAPDCGDLPDVWSNRDIGSPAIIGSACYIEASNSFVIHSNGFEIFKKKDEFHFVHTSLCDDGEIIARLTGLTFTHQHAMAGIMMREGLNEDDRNIAMLTDANGKTQFQIRSRISKSTISNSTPVAAPIWLKIVRSGKIFSGYFSQNGTDWELLKEVELNVNACLEVGLAVTSHDETKVNVATFTEVAVNTSELLENEVPNQELQRATVVNRPITGSTPSTTIGETEENKKLAKEQSISPSQLMVFPNPADQYVDMQMIALEDAPFRVVLYNQLGEQLVIQQLDGKEEAYRLRLDVSSILPGHYQLSVQQNGKVTTKPIVILR